MSRRFLSVASLIIATVAGMATGQTQENVRRAEAVGQSSSGASQNSGNNPNGGYSAIDRAGMTATAVDANKRLSVGDQVSVEIVEDQEGAFPRLVLATGDIEVPPLGRIRVSGKTPAEAARDIKAKLEQDYYYTATVNLAIDRINPVSSVHKVIVTGAVRAPSPIEFPGGDRFTLTEAILRCGGFTEWAKQDQVVLFRKNGSRSVHDLKAIRTQGRISDDPVLGDGDRVDVPKTWFKLKAD